MQRLQGGERQEPLGHDGGHHRGQPRQDGAAGYTQGDCTTQTQSCQVWPFWGQKTKLDNLLSSWPYFRSIKVSIVKSKMLPVLNQIGICQLQAPGNPAQTCCALFFFESAPLILSALFRLSRTKMNAKFFQHFLTGPLAILSAIGLNGPVRY